MRLIIFLCFLLICFLVCCLPQGVLACSYQCNHYYVNCDCGDEPESDECCETEYDTCDGVGCGSANTCYNSSDTPCEPRVQDCTFGENCMCLNPGTTSNRYMCDTGEDKNCTGSCDGEGGCNVCDLPPCSKTDQGVDHDGDGYYPEWQCSGGDCNDGNSFLHPNNTPNPYCNCVVDSNLPAEVATQSSTGVPEFYNCKRDLKKDPYDPTDPTVFREGCLCIDGYDNDCDGVTDENDLECPRVGKDWIIEGIVYTLKKSTDIAAGVYVVNQGTFIIPKGLTLGISKSKGLHIGKGSTVDLRGTIAFNSN